MLLLNLSIQKVFLGHGSRFLLWNFQGYACCLTNYLVSHKELQESICKLNVL